MDKKTIAAQLRAAAKKIEGAARGTKHATLTIKLTFDTSGMDSDREAEMAIRDQLEAIPDFLAGEGMFTGETPLMVDETSFKVDVK
jgi:hypothetical protein